MWEELITFIIQAALAYQASDIHLQLNGQRYSVQLRIHGELTTLVTLSKPDAKQLIAHFKFQSGMEIGEAKLPQTGIYKMQLAEQEVLLRISIIPDYRFYESAVMRIFTHKKAISFGNSSIFAHQPNLISTLCTDKVGLYIFAGSTGSGKTTSMYSLIRQIVSDKKSTKVITIEDPVEQFCPDYLQINTNDKTGLNYETAIKATLRHDPDLLIIGEIRDLNTARMAFRAALTGQLVITTLHANNRYGIILRLLELGITQQEIGQVLLGVSYQKIYALFCPLCNGKCHRLCNHYPNKQTVLYECLTNKEIQDFIGNGFQQHEQGSLKFSYQKGVTYGYLS